MQPVCSTKAKFYEDAFTSLDVACDGAAPLAKKLRCKNLLTDLTLANVALRHQLPKTGTTSVSKELDRLLERLREPNIKHDSQANDLWARFEIAERRAFCHMQRLQTQSTEFNKV